MCGSLYVLVFISLTSCDRIRKLNEKQPLCEKDFDRGWDLNFIYERNKKYLILID